MEENTTGTVTDTDRRFEILVPKPLARMNMGAGNKSESTGPFGYPGVTIQAEDHIVLDANKQTIVQTRGEYCGQSGGQWVQWATGDMSLSTKANAMLSASQRILIAAGAGQGTEHLVDHGGWPYSTPYNSLNLHYRIDRIQTSLFEFFYGRRKRDEHKGKLAAALKLGGLEGETKYFNSKKKASSYVAGGYHGFIDVGAVSLRELYPVRTKRMITDFGKEVKEEGDPILTIDPYVVHGLSGKGQRKDLKHGFSKYLTRLDPYRMFDKADATGPVGKGLVGFLNAMTTFKRFLDVAEQYAWLITDNFLGKRVQSAFAAYTNLMNSVAFTYGAVKMPFGSFADPKPLPGLVDEARSGLGQRGRDPHGAGSPHEAGEAAADAVRDEHRAKVESGEGPWDLSGVSEPITVKWGDKSSPSSCQVDLGVLAAPTPAKLEVKCDGTKLPSLGVTVRVDPEEILAKATTFTAIQAPLADLLGVTESELEDANTTTGATLTLEGERVLFVRCTDFAKEELIDINGTPVTVGDVGTTFAWVDVSGDIDIVVDGATTTVSISTAGLSPTDGVADVAHTALSAVHGVTASSIANGGFTLTTGSVGENATIVVSGDAPWVYALLGLGRGRSVRGEGPLDLSSMTAEQLAARIPASDGLEVKASGGVLTLQAPYNSDLNPRSYVEISGGSTSTLFGDDPKADEVGSDAWTDFVAGEEEFSAGLSQLRAWNHELAKTPEDVRKLLRPIRQNASMLASGLSAVQTAAQKAVETVAKPLVGLPAPPETIGLVADDGIVMGTRDRIVGAGGKGVVFICDGGSGGEDHRKFIPGMESFVNLALKWDPIDAAIKKKIEKGKEDDDAVPSVGFRVLSNDTVDLLGSSAAQLMALGRAKLNSPTPDGKTEAGIGIARVVGSHAAELTGYRKVVIGARNKGDDDKTGGRVEVTGQTIAIGGMHIQGDTKDFDKSGHFGVEPFEIQTFAGAEHLTDGQKDRLSKELATYAWSEELRTKHPNTQRVFVHANKEAVVQVGTYLVHVDSAKGVTIGTRQPSPDASVNVIDETKPRLELKDNEVAVYANKDTRTFWDADGVGMFHKTGKASASSVVVEDAKVTMNAGTQDSITIKRGETTLSSTKVGLLGKTAVAIKASGTIKIG